MARIRTIKPEFWSDERIGSLSAHARLLFVATWNLSDDEGLLRWTPAYVKASVFMYDDDLTVPRVEKVMQELVAALLVFPYSGGATRQELAYIVNFRRHQRINRPQPGKLPPPSLQNRDVQAMYARRDGWRCYLCGEPIESDPTKVDPKLQHSLDHLNPGSKGGTDYPSNIASTHLHCNKSRGNRSVKDTVNSSRSRSMNHSLTDSVPDSTRDGKGLGRDLEKEPLARVPAAPLAAPNGNGEVKPAPEWIPPQERVAAARKAQRAAIPPPTSDELKARALTLAGLGQEPGSIAHVLGQYGVTVSQVEEWIA